MGRKQAVGIRRQKVLELNPRVGERVLDRHHELFHQLEIGLALEASALDPEIEGVGEELLVVGPDVEGDRQTLMRWDAGAGGVERQFADRNGHAVGSQITQTQDSLAVGDHDHPHILVGPVVEELADRASVVRSDVEASRLTKDVGVLLARLAHRWGVDEGHDLHEVVDHRAVEQTLVASLQR